MSRALRFNLILILVAAGTTLAAVAGWRFARASAPVSGPIVLVTIDALRADRLPVYGYGTGSTPALDALAADGVVFERAYTHSPLTLPAHASLLSGRLPPATGVHDDISAPIPERLRLVSSMLADRGYATGGVVSSLRLAKPTGVGQGFTFFDSDFEPGGDADAATPPRMQRDGAESERLAERWLSSAGTSRAFLFLHLNEPHAPYSPPPAFARPDPYDGEVAYVDDIVGRLLAYLKKQQLYDESTIIVVGDHGEGLGDSGEQHHGGRVSEYTSRVPLIIKRAGNAGGGERIGDVVQHVDLVPTILDFARAPVPSDLPGRSLRPLFDGQASPERMVYTETLYPAIQFGALPLRSVTNGQYRYVSGPAPALFDVRDTAGEPRDVSASQPEELARFERAVQELSRDTDVPVPARLSELPPDEHERALALGAGPRTIAGDLIGEEFPPQVEMPLLESYRAAMTAASNRHWAGALDQLRALTRSSPTRPHLWASLAVIAERAGRPDIAIDAYRHVVGILPGEDGVRTRLASVLLRSRRVEDARQQAELAARSDNAAREVDAHELLARAALVRRDAAAARLHAARIREIDPASALPSFVEGRLQFDRGQFGEALEWFERAASEAGESRLADLHWWRGESLLRLDRPDEAADAWNAELRIAPDSAKTYVALANLLQAQGRSQDVERLMTRLVAWRTPEALDSAARFWVSVGDRSRAEAVRQEANRGEEQPSSPRP